MERPLGGLNDGFQMAHQPKEARIIAAITAMAHLQLPTTTISC